MSKLAINQFIKASELYLRLTEKDRSAFNIDEIDRLIYSKNGSVAESIEFSYRGYDAQINSVSAK
jgi:hypothetical protein